jgi:hypothetical protein
MHVSCTLCIIMTILWVDDVLWEMLYCVIKQKENCLKVHLQEIQLWIAKCVVTQRRLKCVSFLFFLKCIISIMGQRFFAFQGQIMTFQLSIQEIQWHFKDPVVQRPVIGIQQTYMNLLLPSRQYARKSWGRIWIADITISLKETRL